MDGKGRGEMDGRFGVLCLIISLWFSMVVTLYYDSIWTTSYGEKGRKKRKKIMAKI